MGTITLEGLTFRVDLRHDGSHGTPQEECDGHGVVVDTFRTDEDSDSLAAKGYRELWSGRRGRSVYDAAASRAKAVAEGWGISPEARAALTAKFGREPTADEVTDAAVDADYEYLRGWYQDEWSFVGVVVTLLDVDGVMVPGYEESLWGVESFGTYSQDVARELAGEIASRLEPRQKYIPSSLRVRE